MFLHCTMQGDISPASSEETCASCGCLIEESGCQWSWLISASRYCYWANTDVPHQHLTLLSRQKIVFASSTVTLGKEYICFSYVRSLKEDSMNNYDTRHVKLSQDTHWINHDIRINNVMNLTVTFKCLENSISGAALVCSQRGQCSCAFHWPHMFRVELSK